VIDANELLETGISFHGHKCPAMPLGLRAAAAAMNYLGVERARDKELHVISETGKGHAAGCFLDGIMVATGCTYGKSNIEKRYYNKMAFTLIDVPRQKAVRVALRPDFFAHMLQSPFIEQRKKGIPPQDISPQIADPLIARVMSISEESFLQIGPVTDYSLDREPGVFEAGPCVRCGEMAFVNKLRAVDGEDLCIPCTNAEQ